MVVDDTEGAVARVEISEAEMNVKVCVVVKDAPVKVEVEVI